MVKRLGPGDPLSRAERYFKENNIGYLLYTPSYAPGFQPIEHFWAYAEAAMTWRRETRIMGETVKLLRCGFFGERHADGTWNVKTSDRAEAQRQEYEVRRPSCRPRRHP